MPGGVSSPVRAYKAVGTDPPVIARGNGSRIQDVDGNTYIDYVCAYGPLILGHAHPDVVKAIREAAGRGTAYGATTEAEIDLASLITEAIPSIELVRFVNSGTEATMSALRLARGYTGRTKIVKFEGGYHGHADGLLAQAGSGQATLGLPDSPGVPASYAAETIVVPYNDLPTVQAVFEKLGKDIAAIIVEPVAGNMGVVPPLPDFLRGLRETTSRYGALLIVDEVITGFRLHYGSAQKLFGVEADLTCLGKIIGGGLPVGAYGGRRQIMELVAPLGAVYQAGTLAGNPLAMAAGAATLRLLQTPSLYARLEEMGRRLEEGLRGAISKAGLNSSINRSGSMLTMFLVDGEVHDYASARRSDTAEYASYFRKMLDAGILLAPSQFEAMFLSTAHTAEDIDQTIEAAENALRG